MDLLKRDKENQVTHLLLKDHIPNNAFINEFQTNFFTLKLNTIEIIEEVLNGYKVDEGGVFLLLHVSIRNNMNEILELEKDDFSLYYDKEGPFSPEENFGVRFQFDNEILFKPFEIMKGCFIFIIDKSTKKICFFHEEYYDDENFKLYRLRYKIN